MQPSPHNGTHPPCFRFEFLEALVRVAVAKYVKPGQCREVPDALETLITDHLKVWEKGIHSVYVCLSIVLTAMTVESLCVHSVCAVTG